MQTAIAPAGIPKAGAEAPSNKPAPQRFLALDAFRGFIMILLVSDGFGLRALEKHPVFHIIGEQFDHVLWVGTHFYDLIAPAFLFMVGMSMPYSLSRRTEQGATFKQNFRHVGMRCLRLMLLSQILISIQANRLHFQMHNILTHIAVACFLCFLIMQLKFSWQVVAGVALLVVHTIPFFLFPAPDGAFTRAGNIAAVLDRAIMGYNYASWTTNMNVISTSVTALLGVWAGYLFRSSRPRPELLKILVIAMLAGFISGLALSSVIPSIRRIWTASFVLWSAGWVILMLLAFYLLIEVAGWRRIAFPLTVVGSNAIFIYSLDEILRKWLNQSVAVFTGKFWFLGAFGPVAQSCAVLLLMWLLCYWLYRRKIFLRL
jgi:heparan-alpha-glucosaminide N-acetyltransferase